MFKRGFASASKVERQKNKKTRLRLQDKISYPDFEEGCFLLGDFVLRGFVQSGFFLEGFLAWSFLLAYPLQFVIRICFWSDLCS